MADFYLFGGPNGAGKTTSALRILPTFGCRHFINADMLAQGLSPLDVDAAAFKAGVALMRELRSLASKREFRSDMSFERDSPLKRQKPRRKRAKVQLRNFPC